MNSRSTHKINRLILIGNGFDLAHGLKTSYSDFVLGFFRNRITEIEKNFKQYNENKNKQFLEHDLFDIKINHNLQGTNPISVSLNTLDDLKEFINKPKSPHSIVSCYIKSDFFGLLVSNYLSKNWIDIENYYYKELIKAIIPTKNLYNPKGGINDEVLNKLNKDFTFIKVALEDYLNTIEKPNKINTLESYLYDSPMTINHTSIRTASLENVMFLNFNYTDTPELYMAQNSDIIYIHGKLKDNDNPLVFGYGDEHDDSYRILEQFDNTDVLSHIKSFDYFKTNNYSRLLGFLESPFDVYIMGHSCGLSDRTLLKTIFEHTNCRIIKIYYHNDLNAYRRTTYEISRHFTSKEQMRSKVINFSNSSPMPQMTS